MDNRDPYWVYAGLQDNHSWMGPSATRHWLGILNQDWVEIGFSRLIRPLATSPSRKDANPKPAVVLL